MRFSSTAQASVASERWKTHFNATGAITDGKGEPAPKYARRVAIAKTDIIRLTDEEIRSKGFVLEGKAVKDGGEDAVNTFEGQAG